MRAPLSATSGGGGTDKVGSPYKKPKRHLIEDGAKKEYLAWRTTNSKTNLCNRQYDGEKVAKNKEVLHLLLHSIKTPWAQLQFYVRYAYV